jgi:hypothetical protein
MLRRIETIFVFLFVLGTARSSLAQDCSAEAQNYRQAVVSLDVKKIKKETGQVILGNGTGFIISPRGYVLTADHVVARDTSIDEIKIFGAIGSLYATPTPLRIVEEDKSADVAVLVFLDQSHLYTPLRFGNPWDVPLGAPLCSLGYSAKLTADYRTTVGALSSLTGQDDANGVFNLWTTQLPSNVGESGSPVLLLPNKGVVAIKYGGERPNVAQDVNYLIPLSLAAELIHKHTGILLLSGPSGNASADVSSVRIQKVGGDGQEIPVGGWKDFAVKVIDEKGKAVAGAKVAWRTPAGGSLAFVSETDATGVARATNLYTFPTEGDYAQTATIVPGNTPRGFVDASKVPTVGSIASFTFEQKKF